MRKMLLIVTVSVLCVLVTSPFVHAEIYGVFMGTTKTNGSSDLPACEDDATDMHNAMVKHTSMTWKNAVVLTGSNYKSSVEYNFRKRIKDAKENDTIFIYNSSHGSEDGKIALTDAAISGDDLAEWLSDSPCKNIVIVNDSCYSGKMKVNMPNRKVVQFSASSAAKTSTISPLDTEGLGHKNSVFTKYFIEALDPSKSDKNEDGKVTSLEVLQYVNKRMFQDEHIAQFKKWIECNPYKDKTDAELIAIAKEYKDKWKVLKKAGGDVKTLNDYARRYFWAVNAQKDWFKELKEGEEGERWQDPTLMGSQNFVMAGFDMSLIGEKFHIRGKIVSFDPHPRYRSVKGWVDLKVDLRHNVVNTDSDIKMHVSAPHFKRLGAGKYDTTMIFQTWPISEVRPSKEAPKSIYMKTVDGTVLSIDEINWRTRKAKGRLGRAIIETKLGFVGVMGHSLGEGMRFPNLVMYWEGNILSK